MIGLYIAFILPDLPALAPEGLVRARAWSSESTTGGSIPIAIVWIVLISILFMLPIAPAGIPCNVQPRLRLEHRELRAGHDRRRFVLFGGWWVLSAKNWFKGPVRMGTDEELEQLEAKQEEEFLLPADTQYETLEHHATRIAARGAARRPSHAPTPSRRRRSGRSPAR